MIRVVLNTNVLVSALLNAQGAPAQALLTILLDPDMQLCVSGNIYSEYEDVIRRPRFERTDAEIEGALRHIRERGLWVRPTEKIRACSDPCDNIFLECALAAAAHYLLTGNRKHFPASWAGTQIVTPRQFLEAIL